MYSIYLVLVSVLNLVSGCFKVLNLVDDVPTLPPLNLDMVVTWVVINRTIRVPGTAVQLYAIVLHGDCRRSVRMNTRASETLHLVPKSGCLSTGFCLLS